MPNEDTNNLIENLIESTDKNSDAINATNEAILEQSTDNGSLIEQQIEVADKSLEAQRDIAEELKKEKVVKVDVQNKESNDGIVEAIGALAKNIAVVEGKKGDKGDKGEKGDTGIKGEKGEDGVDGIDGKDGLNGKDGADGIDGKDGKDGIDGKDGKDAESTEVIKEVVKTIKSKKISYDDLKDKPNIEQFISKNIASKTVSLVELDDVDYSGLTQNSDGKYELGSGSGGGTPGGSDTQMQYNNAGAFGGTTGMTWDGDLNFTDTTEIKLGDDGDGRLYFDPAESAVLLTLSGGATTFVVNKNVEALGLRIPFNDQTIRMGNSQYGHIKYDGSDDALVLENTGEDRDIIFRVDDGGVEKDITLDGADFALKSSTGTFSFDDDNIITTGTITTSDEAYSSSWDGDLTVPTKNALYDKIHALETGIDWQESVIEIQTDGTTDPGASPTLGDRYILSDIASANINFGVILGVADNDIVEYDGTNFFIAFNVSDNTEGGATWVEDVNTFYVYNGTAWVKWNSTLYTASDGVQLTGNDISLDVGGLAEFTGIDFATDHFVYEDVSAGDHKKIKWADIQSASRAGFNDGDITFYDSSTTSKENSEANLNYDKATNKLYLSESAPVDIAGQFNIEAEDVNNGVNVVGQSGYSAKYFVAKDNALTELFYVDSTGGAYFADDVGIGATPTRALHVEKGQSSGFLGYFENTNALGYGVQIVTAGTTSSITALDVNTDDFAILGNGKARFNQSSLNTHAQVEITADSDTITAAAHDWAIPLELKVDYTRGGMDISGQSGGGTDLYYSLRDSDDIDNANYFWMGLDTNGVVAPTGTNAIVSSKNGTGTTNNLVLTATDNSTSATPQVTLKANTSFVGINKAVPTVAMDVVGAGAFTLDVTVPDEVYGVGWNGSLEVPTKNAIYDKIESLSAGGDPDQNLWETVAGDTGSTAADITTDTLTIAGGTGITTAMSGDTLTITNTVTDTNTQLSQEQVEDYAGGMFTGNTETLITATYQDADGTIDLVVDNDLANYSNATSGFITASSSDTLTNKGGNISQWTNDSGYITSTLSEEQVEDYVGGMVTGNTETGITVTYQDGDGTLDFTVSDTTVAGDTGSTGMTPGDTLTIAGGTGITTAMSGDTLTITASGGGDPDQNLFETVATDSGSAVADTTTDTLTLTGGTGVSTSASADTVTIAVASASTTASGIQENATAAEVDTGTSTTRTVTPDALQGSIRNLRWMTFRLVEKETDVATGTAIGGDFTMPFAGSFVQSDSSKEYLMAGTDVAGTTGTMVVDVNKNGTTIMSTNKLDIESAEKTTTTATTQPDLTTTTFSAGDVITFDVDSIHSVAAKGLYVTVAVRPN